MNTHLFLYRFTLFIGLCILFSIQGFAQMDFVENKGQWNAAVQYKGNFTSGSFFLEKKGFTVLLHDTADLRKLGTVVHGHGLPEKVTPEDQDFDIHSFAYKVNFLGANANAFRVGEKMQLEYNNYYLGNDPAKWASGCKIFQAITYKNIYPNIDIRYYSQGERLKYDFIVRPGGNVNAIALNYIGPKSLSLQNNALVISTPVGEVNELSPYSYQFTGGKKAEVNCRYVLQDNVVSFKLDKYDPTQTLVIDPSIIFSSFTGSSAQTWGYTATPGPDGSFFAAGIAFGTGFPVSAGAYQTSFKGGVMEGSFDGFDIALFKFSANGSDRLYATYLGGTGNEQPHSMICDPQGNLVLAGRSSSSDYPHTNTNSSAGYDIVVTKFNASGTALLGSIKIGGSSNDGVNIKPKYPVSSPAATSTRRNYGDDARSEVILDNANNIYLASCTQSNDFPVNTGSPIQPTFGGGLQDGVVMKFSPNLTSVLFSSYFGGNGDDACFVMAINPVTNNLYVGGATASSDLPGNKAGVIGPAAQGNIDGFVTELMSDGSGIIRTSFFGTSGIDLVYGLKFDKFGYPYIMGTTTGNWPVVNAPFSQTGSKQFISKLQPDLSAYVYSTIFGTSSSTPNISPIAFLVDRCQNVYVSGWGGGINVQQGYSTGTTNGLSEVNPLQGIPAADGGDFYFFVLERDAAGQLFGSHFGQNGGLGDHVDGGTSRFDENGVIYQAICANCEGGGSRFVFPTTPGSWSPTNKAAGCSFASVKIEMNFAGVSASVKASINNVNTTSGCIPLLVQFQDTLGKGKKYYWNFADGSPVQITTTSSNSHIFTTAGTYRVMLISEDSITCNIRDTAYINIRAGNNKANLDFRVDKLPPCESLMMQFTNLSVPTNSLFGNKSFLWDYGDGSPLDTAGLTPPRVHAYASAGTYIVKLILIDTSFCNAPDTLIKTIRLSPLVKAQFVVPALGCAPFDARFENTSLAGTDFTWDFGDNTGSTAVSPVHTYPVPGSYNVRLIARDTNTCNKIDTSAYFTITVVSKPVASFSWSPNPPQENVPVKFTNQSVGATRYLWNFGDGDNSTETNPTHQYNATGTYKAQLIAYNAANCTDTTERDVSVIIIPLLDVPNAFTPGRFGVNSVVSVKGFGIQTMLWRVYNRWGQLMFESASTKIGWDGTFKGKLQPTDVYAYTLDVAFTDGTKLRKTGDITLLR
ncbi:MAG: PKD domain-containing protein [Ferruginibacter sp.]